MIKCEICNKELNNLYSLNNHLRTHNIKLKEYYDEYILKNKDDKYCPHCGKEKVFRNFQYIKTCGSKKCKSKQTKNTCIERYGVDNPSKTKEVKNRISKHRKNILSDDEVKNEIFNKNKKTCLDKYGVDHYSKTDEFKEKFKSTSLKKYGVDNPLKHQDVIDKYKNTCLEKYGYDHPMKSEEIKAKLKNSIIDKYGVDNYTKTDEYKEKCKETCLDKYGVDHFLMSDVIINKRIKTMIEKYGVDYYPLHDEFSNKCKSTCIGKYGVDHYSKTNEFKELIKKICLDKYGVDSYFHSEDYKMKYKKYLESIGVDNYFKSEEFKSKYKSYMMNQYGVDHYSKTDEFKLILHTINMIQFIQNVSSNRPDLEFIEFTGEYYYSTYICTWKCKKCGAIFDDYARATNDWLHPRCIQCNPIKYSSIENKVYNYIIEHIDKSLVIRCDRQTITPYELDLYIPSRNLAIECDGTYWHSDEVLIERCGLTYEEHCKIKNDLCVSNNIKLLRFTEDEINNEFNKIKSIIDILL